jgi:hypothetical protein
MARMITGSLNLNEILEQAKAKHSAFSKTEKGVIYFNILVWENDEPDKYNNNFSVQLNASKDAPETEKKKYIGNMKFVATNAQPVTQAAVAALPEIDDLPF